MHDGAPGTADLESASEALDALLPGLGNAMFDRLYALNYRVDELVPARPDLLLELEEHLAAAWARTTPAERPLAVLDVLRALVKTPPAAPSAGRQRIAGAAASSTFMSATNT